MSAMPRSLTLASAAWLVAVGAQAVQRPNIVMFHCHDLGQYLHCYGVKTVRTPNLDAFAAEGVRFARSFCTQPGCSASRASLFTGRYPHNNGVMGLTHSRFGWDLRPDEKHLAQLLKEAGYDTVAVGVIHETRSGPQRCGYDRHIPQNKVAQGTKIGIEELRRRIKGGRPFFLYAGFIEPHRLAYPKDGGPMSGLTGFPGPHLKPDDSLGVDVPGYLGDTAGTREELAGLQGAITHVDEQFGLWMRALQEEGAEKTTLMIVTTDHGIAMPRAKCSVYEPGLQVALILRHAGRKGWHGGIVRNELISNIDVLPTLLEIAGVPVPKNVQGRSFAPLLDGGGYVANAAVYGELTYHGYYDPQRSIRTETHKLIANFSAAPSFQDPSQQWRPKSDPMVPENPASAFHPHLELYDLTADPWEHTNLVGQSTHAAVLKELEGRLYRHMVDTDDPLLRGAVTSPQHEITLKALREEAVPPPPGKW